MWKLYLVVIALSVSPALAQDRAFSLQAAPELAETGLLQHLLPRFSLKTGVRIQLSDGKADAALGDEGVAVFRQDERLWHFDSQGNDHAAAFLAWLQSDVGVRTIESFTPADGSPFSADVAVSERETEVALPGDAVLGETISLERCGRCHVVNDTNRMSAIGSTPSFALMRNFPDWMGRFETFFLLKPHPAFTQVEDVTDPFPDNLPSPIAPIEVTLEDIEAIVAYVATIAPADLGAPIRSQ